MKVNGKDDIPYMKWNIKFMFETTNQINASSRKWNRLQWMISIHSDRYAGKPWKTGVLSLHQQPSSFFVNGILNSSFSWQPKLPDVRMTFSKFSCSTARENSSFQCIVQNNSSKRSQRVVMIWQFSPFLISQKSWTIVKPSIFSW